MCSFSKGRNEQIWQVARVTVPQALSFSGPLAWAWSLSTSSLWKRRAWGSTWGGLGAGSGRCAQPFPWVNSVLRYRTLRNVLQLYVSARRQTNVCRRARGLHLVHNVTRAKNLGLSMKIISLIQLLDFTNDSV